MSATLVAWWSSSAHGAAGFPTHFPCTIAGQVRAATNSGSVKPQHIMLVKFFGRNVSGTFE